MAHGISQSSDMVFNGSTVKDGGSKWEQSQRSGGTPWHGLGVELPGLATAAEVVAASPRFAAPVVKVQAEYNGEPVKGHFWTVKNFAPEDGGPTVVGHVGAEYQVAQETDLLAWAEMFAQDPNGPLFETAAILWGGRKSFVLAKFPDSMIVKGRNRQEDVIGQYLLFSNAHDGSQHLQVQMTPVRVVCQNTLSMAQSGKNRNTSAYLMHSGDLQAKVKNVREILGIAQREFAATQELFQALVNVEPTKDQIDAVLSQLIPDTTSNRAVLQRGRVLELAAAGRGNEPYAGTGWGVYNGYTELVDHHNNQGSKREDAQDMRVNSILFGSGMKSKQEALSVMAKGFLN